MINRLQQFSILIVDDHPIVRSSCQRMLAAMYPACTFYEATDGTEAYQCFQQLTPDIILLDITLPNMGGLEVLRRIQAQQTKAKVIVFSMHDDPIFAQRALQEGACAYVSKSGSPDEVLTALETVQQGKRYLSPEIQQKLVQDECHPLAILSARELELLRLIGAGLNLKVIADRMHISYKTAANNCTLLKSKLGVSQTTELVRIAMLHDLC